MRNFILLIALIAITAEMGAESSVSTTSVGDYGKQKIVLIDSGLNPKTYNQKYLCKGYHKSFVPGHSSWNKDEIGHGSNLYSIITNKIDSDKYCIIIIKILNNIGDRGQMKNTIKALRYLRGIDFKYLNVSFEGDDNSTEELKLLKEFVKRKVHIFVPSGNYNLNLDFHSSYPASYNLDSKYFHIVGSVKYPSNRGSIVKIFERSKSVGTPPMSGTSQSCGLALNRYLRTRKFNNMPLFINEFLAKLLRWITPEESWLR